MKCPRCDGQVLDEKERDGIVIDVCRQCRGLWLDRGELEKLIARATAESDEERRGWVAREREVRVRHHDDDGEDDGRFGGDRDEQRVGRKRRWFESFGDIFD
jgi:Zn-finger nucleic acid-binding protein